MRVLITNDDGIAAPGLHHLAAAVAELGHDVVVAAPAAEQSAMSAALSVVRDEGRVMLTTATVAGLPSYAVAASPAYIVLLAGLGVFGPCPDLVLSGINWGANAGHLILHSGTVGAALTAANNGARGLAVSLAVLGAPDDGAHHWDTAGTLAAQLVPWVLEQPPGAAFNLNVPDRPLGELAGFRQAPLAPFGETQLAVRETGESFVRIAVEVDRREQGADNDLALLREGFATVSPVRSATDAPLSMPPHLFS